MTEISRKQSGQPPSYQTVTAGFAMMEIWRSARELTTAHADAVEMNVTWGLLKAGGLKRLICHKSFAFQMTGARVNFYEINANFCRR
jgi:hypothetical protein